MPGRTLVLVTSRAEHLREYLQSASGPGEIDLCATRPVPEELRPPGSNLHLIEVPRLSWPAADRTEARAIREERFERIVILHNNGSDLDYLGVYLFALRVAPFAPLTIHRRGRGATARDSVLAVLLELGARGMKFGVDTALTAAAALALLALLKILNPGAGRN